MKTQYDRVRFLPSKVEARHSGKKISTRLRAPATVKWVVRDRAPAWARVVVVASGVSSALVRPPMSMLCQPAVVPSSKVNAVARQPVAAGQRMVPALHVKPQLLLLQVD